MPVMDGDFMDLVQQADKYLYLAKESGRNRVMFRE
jgi:PleD family two-component response regulator